MEPTQEKLERFLGKHAVEFHPLVPFQPGRDRCLRLDLSERNAEITEDIFGDPEKFSQYLVEKLRSSQCRYGVGGYGELRAIYQRGRNFDPASGYGASAAAGLPSPPEPRRLHLGLDIWGEAGTAIFAPLAGVVHSFAFNESPGDYGATIILTHQLEGRRFHTLYGHLSLRCLKNLTVGQRMDRGEIFAEMGMRFENGQWPSHLHFQIMEQMEGWEGDYPGVCAFSQRERWMANCPDPDCIAQMLRYAIE